MAKPEYLHLLVKSLSKAEKRLFSLHNQLYKSENDYLALYNHMQKSNLEIKNLKSSFLKQNPHANYNIACQHLYKTIIKIIMLIEAKKDITDKLLYSIIEVKILFKRDLFEESFKLISKSKIEALKHEAFDIFIILTKLELKFLDQLEYRGVDENYILKIQSQIEQISRQQRAINNHSSLYELIHYRQITTGNVRNLKEKEKLNDLVFSELQAMSQTKKESFEARKLHLLFQSAYFMLTANPKSSLKVYTELNALFEENKDLWGTPPLYYLQHLRGILNNLRILEKYDEMSFFIEKIKQVKIESKSTAVLASQLIFIFESQILTDSRKIKDAHSHLINNGQPLILKSGILPLSTRAELFLQIAVVQFLNGQTHNTLKTIRPFLNMQKSYLSLPIIRSIRMFYLILHFEMKNYEYLEYEIKSFERDLIKRNKLHEAEKSLFKFITHYVKSENKTKKQLSINNFLTKLESSQNKQFDFQVFRNFRFTKWLTNKLNKNK